MDRYDVRTIFSMLLTSAGVGLNVIYLQAASLVDGNQGRVVLFPHRRGRSRGLQRLRRTPAPPGPRHDPRRSGADCLDPLSGYLARLFGLLPTEV